MGCNGNCSACSGCARELVLTEKEIAFLHTLGQYAFLPVARAMGDLTPVYLEEGEVIVTHVWDVEVSLQLILILKQTSQNIMDVLIRVL